MTSKKYFPSLLLTLSLVGAGEKLCAQTLTLPQAVETAVSNYGSIKAKANYLSASKATVLQSKKEYLPNLTSRPSRITAP
jgi:outer membrane protein TolC